MIAIEDRKFYQHNGVDLAGMFRAFTRDAGSGRLEQGASTITQQLVKNVWRRNEKRDFKEKMKEAWLAIQLESKLTKSEILEHYLNFVPFGNNAFGVEVAAERYFNKSVGSLTLAESALLAGLVQAPTALDPITHPGRRGAPTRPSARRDAPHPQDHGGASARGQPGAAADAHFVPAELAAQLLHRRADQPARAPRSEGPLESGERARQDQGRGAQAAVPGRASGSTRTTTR